MKKFLLKLLIFFACIVVIDSVWGRVFSFLRGHAKGGSTENCEYIANQANEDIIILGSSRATHHYIPKIIEDSLGVSCYNCGEEGNGIVLAYGRLKLLTNRYTPKLVLYEITPNYDYGTKEPNKKYLSYLRSYYDENGIKEIFDDFDDKLSFLKMKSKMYQNTGRLFPALLDNMVVRDNQQGYAPLYGRIDIHNYQPQESRQAILVDSLKLSYLNKMAELCQSKSIPLVFMISPCYNYGDNLVEFKPAFIICEQQCIPLINRIDFSMNANLFQDDGHMNHEGAVVYTQSIIGLIKEYLRDY